MKNEIIKISKSSGIDIIGFANSKKIIIDYDKYDKQKTLDYKCSFQVGDISDKDLSNEKYKKYNTVIAVGIKYSRVKCEGIHFSSCSQGVDYHIVVKEKMSGIVSYLNTLGYIADTFVDNNPLDEKLLAYNAGLGFFGKNNLLINEEIGSTFFIGIILTDAVIEPDEIVNKTCMNCNLCVKACKAHAINENGILNQNKCISYLTSKKNLTNEEEKLISNCIYGCDDCINACPYNKNNVTEIESINEYEFLNMSDNEFKNIYGNMACAWRGKKVLDRNIILSNKKE